MPHHDEVVLMLQDVLCGPMAHQPDADVANAQLGHLGTSNLL
jgi:hypothetical protein